MTMLSAILKRFGRVPKLIELAPDERVQADRAEIDNMLFKLLPEDEREFIESYFLSDEATVFDCSMADISTLRANAEAAYGCKLSEEELRLPLWVLVSHLKALQS